MAVMRAARGFKSDSSKRPRELNLRCIDALCATRRPREAVPSCNGRDDDAAPGSAGRVPTRLPGNAARAAHFISNGCLREAARHHARNRSNSNGTGRRRPFGRWIAAAARCATARSGVPGVPARRDARAGARAAASRARRQSPRPAGTRTAARFFDADTVARMRRPPHAATGFRARIASGLAPCGAPTPIRVAALAERARAA